MPSKSYPLKKALRKTLNHRRQTLHRDQVRQNSDAIINTISQHFLNGFTGRYGIYLPFGNEVDLRGLLTRQPFGHIPSVEGQAMQFQAWYPNIEISKHPLGMQQPPFAPESDYVQLDCCFLPLLGFDDQCNRLGMGGGFYDRYFADNQSTQLIGVGHDCQQVDSLPVDAWDVKLHAIITESQIIRP